VSRPGTATAAPGKRTGLGVASLRSMEGTSSEILLSVIRSNACLHAAGIWAETLRILRVTYKITHGTPPGPRGRKAAKLAPDPDRTVVAIISSPNRHAITVTDDQVGRTARPPGEGRPGFMPVRGTGPTVSQT
jgi:hypothetical protein